MNPFNHFDFLAPVYDRFIKPADPDRIAFYLKLPSSGVLLDAGGGTGRSSYHLANFFGGVVIADSAIQMLQQASKKNRFRLVCSNTELLPFQNDYFEHVIMVDALHHVIDYRKTLQELSRVVKPGGRIVVEEPDIRTIAGKAIAIFEKIFLMRSYFVSPIKIAQILDSLGCLSEIKKIKSTAWVISDKLAG